MENTERICCLCGQPFFGYGNNPEPLMENNDTNRCCDFCDDEKVIPARLVRLSENKPMRKVEEK